MNKKIEKKIKVVEAIIEKDTINPGTVQGQIKNINSTIQNLSTHLKKHKKDFSSKRAIYKLSKKNKKLKKYLVSNDKTKE